MADKVTFDGIGLLKDGEGNFGFSPGVFVENGRDFVPLGRGDRLLMRELATTGCQHVVELRFYGVDAKGIEDRLRDAWERGLGVLTVRGYGSYTNCALAAPPVLGQGRRSERMEGGSVGVLGFVVMLVFQQVA